MNSKSHALELLAFTHGLLDKMVAMIPADKALYQTHPTGNHLAWTLGHLATTYNWMATLIDAAPSSPKLPESYSTLFGMNSKPSTNKADCPPLAELRSNYDAAFKAFVKSVEKIKDGDIWSPCIADAFGFCSSKLDTAYKCAWHDGWHIGQLSDIRRALGLPSVF